jgi:hypothetical protein
MRQRRFHQQAMRALARADEESHQSGLMYRIRVIALREH